MKKIIILFIAINLCLLGYVTLHKRKTQENSIISSNSFGDIDKEKLLLTEPLQEDLNSEDLKPFVKEEFTITPVKRYRISARILRRENYYFSETHEILPIDLVLGWNIMSDLKTIKDNNIDISQSNRFYYWKIPSFEKIKREMIEINSANVHIGAINKEIKNELENLDKNDLIYFEGYLVNVVNNKNGYRFVSSLTRKDTGAGACEVFLITKVVKINE